MIQRRSQPAPKQSTRFESIGYTLNRVDYADRDAISPEPVVRRQSFKHCDTASHHRRAVVATLPEDFAFFDGKLLVWAIENRRLGSSEPQAARAGLFCDKRRGFPGACGIGGIENGEIRLRS